MKKIAEVKLTDPTGKTISSELLVDEKVLDEEIDAETVILKFVSVHNPQVLAQEFDR